MYKEYWLCEDHFIKTHQRLRNRRYVVRLSFKETSPAINNSYEISLCRLVQVEKSSCLFTIQGVHARISSPWSHETSTIG